MCLASCYTKLRAVMVTHKLTLTLPSMGGTPAKTQALQPGDIVTAWTDQPKARKLEFVIYRIQKGKCALHWQLRYRHADEAALTQIAAANISKVTAGIPQDTEDERVAFLKAEDARDMCQAQISEEGGRGPGQAQEETQEATCECATREPPTLGNILRPADFMAAFQEVRELAQEMKKEQATSMNLRIVTRGLPVSTYGRTLKDRPSEAIGREIESAVDGTLKIATSQVPEPMRC